MRRAGSRARPRRPARTPSPRVGGQRLLRPRSGTRSSVIAPTGRYSMGHGLLRQRVDEPRGDDPHLVHLALEEEVARERGNRPGLGIRRRVAVGELRGQLTPRARDELRRLAAGRDEDRRLRDRTAPPARNTLVLSAPHSPLSPAIRMTARFRTSRTSSSGCAKSVSRGGRAALDAIQQARERRRRDGRLLGLAHLRGRHHLHGLGDLRGAADGLDAPAEIAGAVHVSFRQLPASSFQFRSLSWLAGAGTGATSSTSA